MKVLVTYILALLSTMSFTQEKKLVDNIKIPEGCKYSSCIPTIATHAWVMQPVDLSMTFEADFDESCYYEMDYNGWNKLYRLERLAHHMDRSVRLGWRTNQSQEFEIGLYAHIYEEIESVSMDFSPEFGEYYKYFMRLSHDGIYVRAGENSYCIKRQIFNPNITYETGGAKGAFFGDPEVAPHNMYISVKNREWNTGYSYWYEGYNKGYCNSIFYNGESSTIDALNNIIAPLDDTHDSDPSYTIIENGSFIIFKAGETIHLYKGFHAEAGSHFIAKISPYPQVTSIPNLLTQTVCYNVENVDNFSFSLYGDKYYNEYITGGSGTINGSSACYTFTDEDYEALTNVHYWVRSVFSSISGNSLTVEHDIFKINAEMDSLNNFEATVNKFAYNTSNDVDRQTQAENYESHSVRNIQYSENKKFTESIALNDPGQRIKIYPNPNAGVFVIEWIKSLDLVSSIIVMNNLGNVILKKEELSSAIIDINLTNHPRGIYFVKVQADGQLFTEKIIYQ